MKKPQFHPGLLWLMVFFLSALMPDASAQELPRISGNFSNLHFSEWVTLVESQSPYTFYYRAEEIDTIHVNLNAEARTLPSLLEELFKGTAFNYSIDRQNNVFVAYGWVIQTDFVMNFSASALVDSVRGKALIVDNFNEATEKSDDKLYAIGIKSATIRPGRAVVSGRVLHAKTGEPIVGGNVFTRDPLVGVSTDPLGYYTMPMSRGRHTLYFSSLGMRETARQLVVYGDGKLNVELTESVQSLKEVVVTGDRDIGISRTEMGIEKMDIRLIKKIPTALGEADVIKALLTLPGVNSVGEASAGFNVRGGAADQNLVLLNDAVIFNPAHLFGFFPSFNPDIVKDVELYKSSMPAKFGGRLASVLDIQTREGNKKEVVVSGGIGPVAGRINIEGPIAKGKTSFLVSGRGNYSDWLLRRLENETYKNSKASFYDLNLGISHQIDEKNNLFLNAYYSDDAFRFRQDTTYTYRNFNASLKWTHLYGSRLYSNVLVSHSRYDYSVESTRNPATAYDLSYAIEQSQVKADFNYFHSDRHAFDFGASVTRYAIQPGSYLPKGAESLVAPDRIPSEQALESALYFSDKYMISPSITMDIGLRYSLFHYLGPRDIAQYAAGVPKSEFTRTGTKTYGAGDIISTYHGPELRAAVRKTLSETASVKISFTNGRQYLHLLSNTAAISPTDIWKLSDPNIQPQLGQQFSTGFYKNLRKARLEMSVEAYYKTTQNYLDYKSGASLVMNHHLETDVITTHGQAYGIEVQVKKPTGKLNGWVSYTYSRSLLQVTDPQQNETINNGNRYPSNYDKPHNVSVVGNYKFNHRVSTSLNFTYSTGRPITLPIAQYAYDGSYRVYYSNRNDYRIPDYFRIDVSVNIEGNHKIKKLAHSSWTLAVYNLTGRRNPYSVYFTSTNGNIEGYKLSILGQPIPTITYNFRF